MKVGDKLYCYNITYVDQRLNNCLVNIYYNNTRYYSVGKYYKIMQLFDDNTKSIALINDKGDPNLFTILPSNPLNGFLDEYGLNYSMFFYTEIECRKLKLNKLNEI